MLDIWAQIAFNQLEFAVKITRAAFGMKSREVPVFVDEVPVSVNMSSAVNMVPHQVDAPAANLRAEPAHITYQEERDQEQRLTAVMIEEEATLEAAPISEADGRGFHGLQIISQNDSAQSEAVTIMSILSFLETAQQGATVLEISERLQRDKMMTLSFLKTLVREGSIDELLGRYYVLRS